ncbi:MAG: hypothetical protein ACREEM_41735, partial [Blastocatellia bacterium]
AAPLLANEDADLRRAALWVISHHTDWAGAVTEFLRARLLAPKLDASEAAAVHETLLAFAADSQVQSLVTQSLNDQAADVARHQFLLDAIERCALKQLPADWIATFARLLGHDDARTRQRTIALIRARRVEGLGNELNRIAFNSSEAADLRVAALSAIAARDPKLTDAAFNFLSGLLPIEQDPALRLSAAQCLGQSELNREQLLALATRILPRADSLTLLPLLDAFRATKDEAIGQALLTTLNQPEVNLPKVNLEAIGGKRIEQLFKNFPAVETGPLMAKFRAEEAARLRRLQELEPLLAANGDVGTGRRIFFGTRAACGSCHTIGLEGGHVGPDLTSVGSIRSGHDILEAIAFPSATMVPGHESRRVTTKTNNQVYSGVISEFESTRDTVVVVSGPNDKVRIPRDEIASIASSNVSLMPDGFATQLTRRELTDLLAFLRAQK